jgi:hypothetical protein
MVPALPHSVPPGDVPAEQVGHQQHHGHGDGAAEAEGGPVVSVEVGVEADRGRHRADQGSQHSEGPVGDQHPGQEAGLVRRLVLVGGG